MEATYIRAKVPNSFSRRMKLLCKHKPMGLQGGVVGLEKHTKKTLTEHDRLKEGEKLTLQTCKSLDTCFLTL